ncbi:MAG: hypothetical protein LBI72_10540 [Flavobacteriaceae bacterium]|jgi:vacuolar-type H+-ATPase catalytic subunit A/Vma1|nr:hypothetical protein [Flavobacteriaceae bacterium]
MKNIFLLLAFGLLSTLGLAQSKESHEQIRSLKIAHISSALNLTTDEAERFWPIFTAYDNKMSSLRHNPIVKYIKYTDIDNLAQMSDKEAASKLQELIDYEDEYFSTRQKFIQDVKKILNSKKIILLKKAEDDFNRNLLKKYKEKK